MLCMPLLYSAYRFLLEQSIYLQFVSAAVYWIFVNMFIGNS